MTDYELNIHNYNYNDILTLFKLTPNYTELNIPTLQTKLNIISTKSPQYYNFYLKAFKIILFIDFLTKKQTIDNEIDFFVNKLKNIDNFEFYDNDNIYELLGFNFSFKNSALQEQVVTNPIVNNYPNDLTPGNLNSIKRITQTLNLNLNSCFRNNYYNSPSTDFQYTIPTELKNITSLRLASIELPNSWYLISILKKNNLFDIIINDISYRITIPEGNYDSITIQNYLNDTYFYSSGTTTPLINIKFSIDQNNFKTKFELWDETLFDYSIIFFTNLNNNLMNTFGWLAGFRKGKYIDIMNELVSEGLFDPDGDRYVYVSVNDYQYNTNVLNMVCFDNSLLEKNIIAKIPMFNGKISLNIDDSASPLTKRRLYNGPINLKVINIKILDQFGNVIDLNNMDFSFTLELEILYEGFNFKNINN